MNCHENAEPDSARHTRDVDLDGVIRSITGQFAIVFGKPERVAECCSQLERSLSAPPAPSDVERLLLTSAHSRGTLRACWSSPCTTSSSESRRRVRIRGRS